VTESTSTQPSGDRDEQAVSRFVERFAALLVDGGWPSMAARVFGTLLASETGHLTAAELAERLKVSPAAISGAVRFLGQLNLASRERQPGSRRDFYRVDDDVWFNVFERSLRDIAKWGDQLADGIAAVGKDTPAGTRLAETAGLFEFIRDEFPTFMRRWRETRSPGA
jgi:predicted transcriptional regulator